MNKIIIWLLAPLSLFLAACVRPVEPTQYTEYKPILLTRESMEKSIQLLPASDIKNPAKIYYKDNYIFISEKYKGVHIINNSDPKSPQNTAFISVPGCVDMAIKENALYIDNAIDLVVVDLQEIKASNIKVTKRVRDAFPEITPPDGLPIPSKYSKVNRPANTILVEWVK